jgi:hypothetical protein
MPEVFSNIKVQNNANLNHGISLKTLHGLFLLPQRVFLQVHVFTKE